MKTIILAISLVSVAAFAQVNQTEMSRTVAQIASVDSQISAVKLNESGVLTVSLRDQTSKTLVLSKSNKEDLLASVQNLSDVELKTENRVVVCQMMVAPFSLQYLSVLDTKTNKLKMILSPSFCSVTSYTHPKEDYFLADAQDLKAKLIVLARQLVKN